ncbi:MAG: hypothetical protein K2Y01_09890 [Rhabdochlamydiaceae bacterium]|nr:hypothetical protein [Rhabdochlamydiaceae bacterium]
MSQQGTATLPGAIPVHCVVINETSDYTYSLSTIRQSCSGGLGCVQGVVSFGYTTSSGSSVSECQGSLAAACSDIQAAVTAGCSSGCVSDCSCSCIGSNCNCGSYSLGCPDPCQCSLSGESNSQYLTFNVPGSYVLLIYNVYRTVPFAYVTTIGVAFVYSIDGTTITASIPTITGFSLRLEDVTSPTSVVAEASASETPEFFLKYTPPS